MKFCLLVIEKMPTEIGGFSQIEYLTVFNTIIFGVVATEYFSGWGNMLRYRGRINYYLLHFLWTLFSFLTLIQNWFGIWPRVKYINDNVLFFFYSLVPMFVFHLLSVTLFPTSSQGQKLNFKQFYFKNSRVFFIIYALYFAVTISSSFVYDDKGDVLMQNVLRSGALILSLACAYFHKNAILHYIFLAIGFIGLIQFLDFIPK